MTLVYIIGNNVNQLQNEADYFDFTTARRYNDYNDIVLQKAFKRKDCDVRFVDFYGLKVSNKGKLYYENKELQHPDLAVFSQAIFTFPGVDFFEETNDKLDALKKFKTVFVNDIDSHWKTNNKVYMYEALRAAKVPIPITKRLHYGISDTSLNEIVDSLGGYPVVTKVATMSRGVSVFKANNFEELRANEKLARRRAHENPLIIQQHVRESEGLMIAARVIGDKILARYHMGSPQADNAFKSDLAVGKLQIACNVDEGLRKMLLTAMRVLKLDTARIDVFVCDNSYKICGVNSMGSLYGLDVSHNTNQADEIASLALTKLSRRVV